MQCLFSGNASYLTWTKTQRKVTTNINLHSSKYSGGTTTNPNLVVTNLDEHDTCKYTCQIDNLFGTSNASVFLKVICKSFNDDDIISNLKKYSAVILYIMLWNTVNVLIFALASFHGFCHVNVFAGINLRFQKNDQSYIMLKINVACTIFRGFLSTTKKAKISTFTVPRVHVHENWVSK